VIDGRIQGQGTDGTFLPVEIVPDGLRWRGELWVPGPLPLSAPPAALAGHLGTYGPDFMPTHLTFSDGRLNCLIEALCAHTCEPVGGNRYLMRGPLYEDEVLEVGVFKDGRPALRVGEMFLDRLS
jgi:D-alanyl-D-alanine dipeptidase